MEQRKPRTNNGERKPRRNGQRRAPRREEKELKKKKNISRQKNLLKRQPQRSLDYCTRESIYSKDQMTDRQQN